MNGELHTDSAVPAEADDASLIRDYADRNDHDALGLLFRRHSDFAYRVAMRILRDPGEAEDAVQMAFVRIMQASAGYRGGEGVKVWMMKIVTNTCKNMIKSAVRRRKREEIVAGEADGVTGNEPGVVGELVDLVQSTLEQLPEKYRLSLWLHHYEGLPFQEVAQILSTPEATVRSHASRGLTELREKLARAGAAVPALSIAGALGSIPAETAPVSLVQGVADIVAGVGKFAEISAMADAIGAGGQTLTTGVSLKAAIAVGLVATSTAVVGIVWTLNRSEPAAATATPAAMAADVLFRDDFEQGWQWSGGTPGDGIMEGKGISGSRAMRFGWAGASVQFATSPFVSPVDDFDVSFKVFAERDEMVVGVGTGRSPLRKNEPFAGGVAGMSGCLMLWGYEGTGSEYVAEPGRWLDYRVAVRGSQKAATLTVSQGERVIWTREYSVASAASMLKVRRLGVYAKLNDARLQETSQRGTNVLYVDDFVVRRPGAAEPGPAAWSRQWDFSSPELPAELEVDVGSWRYVPNGGSDGSGCMQTDSDTFSLSLNVPVDRLPVIVSWREGVVYKPGFKYDWTSAATWKAYKSGTLLHGLNRIRMNAVPLRPGDVAPWEEVLSYLGDGFIVQLRRGILSNFVMIEPARRTSIQVLFRGPHRVDDLSIRSARPEEMPDVTAYLQAIGKIPPDQRKGAVVVPDLNPAPGQKVVTAEFFGPNT